MNNIFDKKHIIITGLRDSGKSTLLKKLLPQLGTDIPGITTWCEPQKAVYMRLSGTDAPIIVGQFNPDSTSKENRMMPVPDSFNIHGVAFLDSLINAPSEWVSIDEIGYLESTCTAYTEKLYEVFDKKRVIAVVRKQDIEFLNNLCNRTDAKVIDLDLR